MRVRVRAVHEESQTAVQVVMPNGGEEDESFDFKGLVRDFLYSPTHGIEFELFDEDKLTENDSIGAPPPHPNPIALTLSPSP